MRFTCYGSEVLILNTTFLFIGANLVLELDISLKKTPNHPKLQNNLLSYSLGCWFVSREVCVNQNHTDLVRK